MWDTGVVTPAQLQSILRGVQVELGGYGSARGQELGNVENVSVVVTDAVTDEQVTGAVYYQEIDQPGAILVGPGETVTGGTLTVGDSMEVESGGTANGVTLTGINGQGGGSMLVDSGGVANGTIVDNQGDLNVDGTANSTVINSGGYASLGGNGGGQAGGVMNNTVLNGGQLGAASGTAVGTIINSGGLVIEQWAAIDQKTVVNKGGEEEAC